MAAMACRAELKDDPKLFLSIADDGTVNLLCIRAEMGQGIRTSWGMVVADELEAELGRVKVLQAPGDQARFGNQDTDGSRSMRHHFEPLRRIAAAARMMLEQEAAARWGVPVTEVKAENNGIVHAASGRRLDFGALAKGAAARPVPPSERPGPEGREPVPLHRQGQRALDRQSRHHHRQGHVRHRRARRRHGLCGGGAAAGVRRQGQELRCRQGDEGAGRAQGRGHRRRRLRLSSSSRWAASR